MGETVYQKARVKGKWFFIPDAGHNDLLQFGMAETVTRFLDGLPPLKGD